MATIATRVYTVTAMGACMISTVSWHYRESRSVELPHECNKHIRMQAALTAADVQIARNMHTGKCHEAD